MVGFSPVPVMLFCRMMMAIQTSRVAAPILLGLRWNMVATVPGGLSLLTLSVERKSGGDLAAPAMVCHPKAAISAVADWRPALALAATGAS